MSDTPRLLTDAELAAIAKRADKATPGPWCAEGGSLTDWGERSYSMEFIDNRRASKEQRDADLEFMAKARSDIPALLAENQRLRAWCRRLVEIDKETDGDALGFTSKALDLSAEMRAALEGK